MWPEWIISNLAHAFDIFFILSLQFWHRSPLFSSEDETAFDIGILLLIGSVYKVFYIVGVLYKTSQVSMIEDTKAE
jgi:hypothetical protein